MAKKAAGSESASRKIRVPRQVEEVEPEEFEAEEEFEVNAYVPDPKIGTCYMSRQVLGGVWDMDVLNHAIDNAQNVLLMGPTGAGKTMVGEAFAAQAELLYYSLPCDVSIDPSALFGKIVPTEDGTFEWIDGPVTQLARYGGVLNISEINFMPPRIAASLYPLLDSRRYLPLLGNRGEVVRPHRPDCWCDLDEEDCKAMWLLIIADMNPQYRGTQDLNAAFKNRFSIKVPWDYDPKVESALITNGELISFAKKLRERVGSDLRTPVATNMLLEFEKFQDAFGLAFAAENFIAAFDEVERSAVKQVWDLHKGNVSKVYEEAKRKRNDGNAKDRMRAAVSASEIEDDEDEFEFEMEG